MASVAPQNLIDLKHFLADQEDVDKKNFGIRGGCGDGTGRVWGFHLARKDIFSDCGKGRKDYSIRHKRNFNNLTEFSAGFDGRLPQKRLRAITAYMVTLGKAGWKHPKSGRTVFYEVLGPAMDGTPTRWAVDTGWKPTPASRDHAWHFHAGFWRDVVRFGVDVRSAFLDFYNLNSVPDEPVGSLPPGQGEEPAPPDQEQPELPEVPEEPELPPDPVDPCDERAADAYVKALREAAAHLLEMAANAEGASSSSSGTAEQ